MNNLKEFEKKLAIEINKKEKSRKNLYNSLSFLEKIRISQKLLSFVSKKKLIEHRKRKRKKYLEIFEKYG